MNAELTDYYQNLLLMEYLKPKAKATVSLFVTASMIYDLITAVRDGYDPVNAIGANLDVVGKYRGVTRINKGFPLQSSNFGYARYGETPPLEGISPYSRYGSPPIPSFRTYRDGRETYVLTDSEFQLVIGLAIRKNNGNGSMASIDDILYPVFGDLYLAVETPMGIAYFVQQQKRRLAELIRALDFFPHPMGVKTTVTVKVVLSS